MTHVHISIIVSRIVFFFNDTATTEIYTLSLHDALPISCRAHRSAMWRMTERAASARSRCRSAAAAKNAGGRSPPRSRDRKSTRLNSSHGYISYAVFCLKKKKKDIDRAANLAQAE